MSQWQPIETCPEQRTVLLFGVTERAEDGTVLNWKMDTGCRYGRPWPYENESVWLWGRVTLMLWDPHPTHWMPLPEPPATS